MSTKGTIGVTTENIFPVIKKFLYSDHEIFLRELVSNAIDASNKLKALSSVGEFKGEIGELKVTVTVDKEAGTLTVSDRGIGMTADDIDKYINQIAFSGAEEFLAKYKDKVNNIIGHFGLGFYSAFMVASKVEIRSLSYKDGAEAVSWTCDGSPEYTMNVIEKGDRGTDIILTIDEENKEFLEQARIDTLLKKYCRFLPVPVFSGDKEINNTAPAWTKKPSELTDDDYKAFYRELYPGQDEPLFWIHLNVDYPFTLTGILFFPKIKNNIDVQKNRIQLYCNQVFVTDSVEGVVPEFMMLMQGVIDSPDIPLNVSRSYLQSDSAVKKISTYITRKVADRLEEIFKNDRQQYETKWDDIKLFIEYGMLTDQKFCDCALKFLLLKDTDDRHFTLDEYKTLIEPSQTDKDGTLVYLYTTDKVSQYNYINDATAHGYNVLNNDDQLGSHFIGLLEQKQEKSRFVRVDSDVIDNLILKADKKAAELTEEQKTVMTSLFRTQLPAVDKAEFMVQFEALSADSLPLTITQNEYMRRMKEMATMQPGMDFYSMMPDSYNLIVNTSNPLIATIMSDAVAALSSQVSPLTAEIDRKNAEIDAAYKAASDGKLSDEQQKHVDTLRSEVDSTREQQTKLIADYAANQPKVKQLLDLALLGNGLLKGSQLSDFIRRSVQLL